MNTFHKSSMFAFHTRTKAVRTDIKSIACDEIQKNTVATRLMGSKPLIL